MRSGEWAEFGGCERMGLGAGQSIGREGWYIINKCILYAVDSVALCIIITKLTLQCTCTCTGMCICADEK